MRKGVREGDCLKQNRYKYKKIFLNLLIAIVVLLVVIFVVPRGIVLFMPFILGWLVSLMANPLVKFLEEKLKIKRKALSAMVIILVIAAVITVCYLIIAKLLSEFLGFMEDLPALWRSLQITFQNISKAMDVFVERLPENMQGSLDKIGEALNIYVKGLMESIGTPTVVAVGSFAKNIPSFVISLIMTLLSSYFFTAEKEYLNHACRIYVPKGLQKQWEMISGSLKTAVGGYLKAQLKIEFWIYLLLVIGLEILRIDYSLLIALGIAILDVLPFFGTGAVMVPWGIINIFNGKYNLAIGLFLIWGLSQLVRQIIQPKIVGDSIGVPPIPTLFLLFIGYKAAGVIGMIVAVPIGIILVNMNQSGLFDNTKTSLLLLGKSISDFRKYSKEDISCLEEEPDDD